MARTRSRLVAFVFALLSWQAVSTLAAPLAVCYANALPDGELVCTCSDGAGASCPMHHAQHRQTSDAQGGPRLCNGCPDAVDSALAMMTGPIGVPPVTIAVVAPDQAWAASWFAPSRLVSHDAPPFSPPPRS